MVLRETDLPRVRASIRLHRRGFHTAYPPRRVNNIYFDTEDLASVRDNVAGIGRRVKARLRWYGPTWHVDRGVFELKCKLGLLGWKLSHPIEEALDLSRDRWSSIVRALGERLPDRPRTHLLLAHRPVIINRYRREYFVAADGKARVTLDSDLAVYAQWAAARPNLLRAEPDPHRAILEVKMSPGELDRLAEVLDGFAVTVSKHSKFVAGALGHGY